MSVAMVDTPVAIDIPAKIVDPDTRKWHSLASSGYPGTEMKVLHVDDEGHSVHFLFSMKAGTGFPRHLHVCRAIVYTLEGEWDYEEGHMGPGSLVIEEPGSYHTPTTKVGCVLLTHLISHNNDMLNVDATPDGSEKIMLNLDFYRQYL
jgi:anti-sigma factor ChrR (cupin superfamily)